MLRIPRQIWLVVPIVASLATTCDESPRGAIPSQIVGVQFRLDSQPEPPPPPSQEFEVEVCLTRIDFVTSVTPSWRNNEFIELTETAANVFSMQFDAVPIGLANTMTVRDVNECRRNPSGNGIVVSGVTVNGTPIERTVPNTRVLTFIVNADGTVDSPPLVPPTQ